MPPSYPFLTKTICHIGISHEQSTDMTLQQQGLGIMFSQHMVH